MPGLAVNYPETNEVLATIEGEKTQVNKVIKLLKQRLAKRERTPLTYGKDYTISHVPEIQEKMKNVVFTPKDMARFERQQHDFDKLKNYDMPGKMKYFQDRYRLQPDAKGNLTGRLPGKAVKQLFNGAPMYHRQYIERMSKQAGLADGLARGVAGIGKSLGLSAMPKIYNAAKGAFRNFSSLGDSVPAGIMHTERNAALNAGNQFMQKFKPDGFKMYAGRVKTPESLAGHGGTMTNDLLGFRLSPGNGGYTEQNVNNLVNQLQQAGVTVSGQKKLVRPGYHGWNIKGTIPGEAGAVPVEFQMTPRRTQGLFAADHTYLYKPETSGVAPGVANNVYSPAIKYMTNVVSPMVDPAKRLGYAAAGVGTVGGVGALGYAGLNGQPGPNIGATHNQIYDRVPTQQNTVDGSRPVQPGGYLAQVR